MTSERTADAGDGTSPEILWSPPPDVLERSRMGRYLAWLGQTNDLHFDGYGALWRWSVDEPGAFWRSIWDHFEVVTHEPPTADLADARMPEARWFPGATLNYAEQIRRRRG